MLQHAGYDNLASLTEWGCIPGQSAADQTVASDTKNSDSLNGC
ncbi:MAG: hypothetical protein ABL860_01400 [Candidatus Nitrotoga sp.]